jgi:hypothetical protein
MQNRHAEGPTRTAAPSSLPGPTPCHRCDGVAAAQVVDQMAFVVSRSSPSTVGRGGERRPDTHHGTQKYRRPRWCRRTRSCCPGCRNRHWIERRFRVFSGQLLDRRFLDHHAARVVDDVLQYDLDHRDPSPRRPVVRAGTDTARTPHDAHGGMCDKSHHRHRYHVERLGRW